MPDHPDVATGPPSGRTTGPTRRQLLGLGSAALAAPLLAACSTPVVVDEVGPRATPSLSPDVFVATRALAEVTDTAEAVSATTAAFPGLAAALAAVTAMHETHRLALVDAVPDGADPGSVPRPYAVPARRAVALARLRSREQELRARLEGLAIEASSGSFAALLAAMSAGTAQRVAVWPT